MARRITVDEFAAAAEEILHEYADQVGEITGEAVEKVTKLGVKTIKSNSAMFGGTGKYASGWTSRLETGYYSKQGIIYNSKVPGLPHLLEHGHAKRNGGRVDGRVHIAPVEDVVEQTFMKELEGSL